MSSCKYESLTYPNLTTLRTCSLTLAPEESRWTGSLAGSPVGAVVVLGAIEVISVVSVLFAYESALGGEGPKAQEDHDNDDSNLACHR